MVKGFPKMFFVKHNQSKCDRYFEDTKIENVFAHVYSGMLAIPICQML